jgi:hypothetical protein
MQAPPDGVLGEAPGRRVRNTTLGEAYDQRMPKGWDRTSIAINTRPIHVERDIRRQDLLAPAHDGIALLLAACLGCGLMISLLYVFFPLLLITFAGVDLGAWLIGLVLASAVVSTIVLFVAEIRSRRDFVNEL